MKTMQRSFVTITLLLAGLLVTLINCQTNQNELDVNELEKKLGDIPGFERFNSSKLPTEQDIEKVLLEKCEKNGGGEEAYNTVKEQQNIIKECIEQQLNFTEIQLELEEAKKTGSMDEVFGKYCKKYPEVYQCFTDVTDHIRLCMDDQEQRALDIALNITNELSEFLCYKDGDRIAMFVAEGGIECLQERKEGLQECANKTIGARIPTELSINTLPTFLFSESDCNDIDKIRRCFNTELEKCKDSTPANIIDAFFKFVKKHTPCVDKRIISDGALVANDNGNSASTSTATYSISLSFLIVFRSYFLH